MQQQDFLERQIEQLGRVLATALARMLKLPEPDHAPQVLMEIEHSDAINWSDLPLDDIEQAKALLMRPEWNAENALALIRINIAMAKHLKVEDRLPWVQSARYLFEALSAKEETLTFSMLSVQEELNQMI